jgi:hypothetical protein
MADSGGTADGGADTTASQTFTITIAPVNDAPSFTKGTDQSVLEDNATQTVTGWASSISQGPSDESVQTLMFTVTNDNHNLFGSQPDIDAATGTLTYTPAPDANGTATVTVTLSDSGGMANGGADMSPAQTFTITVTPVNDAPAFDLAGSSLTVGENTGEKIFANWAANISVGPPDEESTQAPSFNVIADDIDLFTTSGQPAISASGTLTFTPAASGSGSTMVSVTLTDGGGTANGGVDTSVTKQFEIRIVGSDALVLEGTVSDAATDEPVSGAEVSLLDYDGNELASDTTEDDGTYRIEGLTASSEDITLKVSADGYQDNARTTQISFARSESGTITEDFLLSAFTLELTADPPEILGDGKTETTLTATVTDKLGNPISGVLLTFNADKGTFLGGTTTTTGLDGIGSITFVSEKLSGTEELRVPVSVSVSDEDKKLYGTEFIYERFVPGFVEGVVTDGNEDNQPVEGAIVVVYKDFDGDGTIGPDDFTAEFVTGPDGKYSIAIPKGGIEYNIRITKPVEVGNSTVSVTFEHTVEVGDVNGTGDETSNPTKSASGVVIQKGEDGTSSIVENMTNGMALRIEDSEGNTTDVGLNSGGVFQTGGLTEGTYFLQVVYEMDDGSVIIVGSTEITITEDGEMNISEILIDPYGTITDSSSGEPVEGAEVTLYYADTERNILNGITPDTAVTLPAVSDFPPADNGNPQASDAYGLYAFMVYPHTDYYIVAEKSGYETYTSDTIPVADAIVNWDFEMAPVNDTGAAPVTGTDNDLAIEISSEKMKVEEGSSAALTVLYKNNSDHSIADYTVSVTVPDGMSVADTDGGRILDGAIVWAGTDIDAGEIRSLHIVLTAPMLTVKEQTVTAAAAITCTLTLSNTEDDISSITFLLYSNNFDGEHTRYIKGYPDGTFGPYRNLTRAEAAGIFARLLDLDVSDTKTAYSDVDENFWAAGYIAALTDYGFMNGYPDGSFRPDRAITRAEFAAMAARYFGIERSSSVAPIEEHFSDIDNSWARSTIEEVYRYGITNGYADGTFKPDDPISRAEAVTLINRMLFRGPVAAETELFSDISTSDWFYGQVIEASLSHKYTINPDAGETVTEWKTDDLK